MCDYSLLTRCWWYGWVIYTWPNICIQTSTIAYQNVVSQTSIGGSTVGLHFALRLRAPVPTPIPPTDQLTVCPPHRERTSASKKLFIVETISIFKCERAGGRLRIKTLQIHNKRESLARTSIIPPPPFSSPPTYIPKSTLARTMTKAGGAHYRVACPSHICVWQTQKESNARSEGGGASVVASIPYILFANLMVSHGRHTHTLSRLTTVRIGRAMSSNVIVSRIDAVVRRQWERRRRRWRRWQWPDVEIALISHIYAIKYTPEMISMGEYMRFVYIYI